MLDPIYLSLGGQDWRSAAIRCYDWLDLIRVVKRGSNRTVPQHVGSAVRPRYHAEVRAGLMFRIQGRFNHPDGTAHTGDPRVNVYALLGTLKTVCEVDTPQTLQLVGASAAADCIVEEMGAPTFVTPEIVTVMVDVTLPGGPLELAP
jgi:hypothetical protein